MIQVLFFFIYLFYFWSAPCCCWLHPASTSRQFSPTKIHWPSIQLLSIASTHETLFIISQRDLNSFYLLFLLRFSITQFTLQKLKRFWWPILFFSLIIIIFFFDRFEEVRPLFLFLSLVYRVICPTKTVLGVGKCVLESWLAIIKQLLSAGKTCIRIYFCLIFFQPPCLL